MLFKSNDTANDESFGIRQTNQTIYDDMYKDRRNHPVSKKGVPFTDVTTEQNYSRSYHHGHVLADKLGRGL
ncbi:hypothetical protein DPMN_092627 [Dreissena polymorpha]|uniref:Uncharacterized protein n=1 Tax=Dreissena polymorpha TaxID=45954 RepID=A0A9D4L1R0_DREPO|nr:hypothetical protein DPMN_092627 [Dreissena polymorpha]